MGIKYRILSIVIREIFTLDVSSKAVCTTRLYRAEGVCRGLRAGRSNPGYSGVGSLVGMWICMWICSRWWGMHAAFTGYFGHGLTKQPFGSTCVHMYRFHRIVTMEKPDIFYVVDKYSSIKPTLVALRDVDVSKHLWERATIAVATLGPSRMSDHSTGYVSILTWLGRYFCDTLTRNKRHSVI